MPKKARSRFISKHQEALQLGAAVLFLILVGVYASLTGASTIGLASSAVWLLIVAASVGAYMAMNIGANDVANNMGPAVGSGAMTMGWAIVVAAVFEALGAIVAGGEVVGTIKGGIIDADQQTFAWSVDIKTFDGFNSPLQREHFNENYMETKRFPKATFSGKIIEKTDFSQNGTYTVRAKGLLNNHGVEQERIIKSTIEVKNGQLRIKSQFTVPLSDHNISIPKIVHQKIAEEIKVTVEAVLK